MKETYFKENLNLYPELDFSLERKQKTEQN
jgi:hypothetical protein